MIFYSHLNKTHFHKNDFALASFWKWEVLELGNGPLLLVLLEHSTWASDSPRSQSFCAVSNQLPQFILDILEVVFAGVRLNFEIL